MTRNGEPISEWPLRRQLATGIAFDTPIPILVPEIEEREAAVFNGYTWREWCDLERDERIDGIAHHRLRRLIEQHVHDASVEHAERQRQRNNARVSVGDV